MLSYLLPRLSPDAESWLSELQARIDSQPDRQRRYQLADKLFANKKNAAFAEVKTKLGSSSPPGRACFYCERDRYRDIEHIRPKRHFPEQCFLWTNYVYACTICNQDAKNDRYAVIQDDGQLIEFDRSWPVNRPLPEGIHAFLDIRSENPLDFLILDLFTGRLVPLADAGVSRQRAIFTRDLLGLDSDDLSRLRRQAVVAYTNYLTLLLRAKNGEVRADTNRILNEILELPQPTVLVEMLRQKHDHLWLRDLIDALPNDFALWRHVDRALGPKRNGKPG